MNDTMPIGPTQASQLYAEPNAANRRIRELEAELARQQDLNGLWQDIQFWKSKCRPPLTFD